MDTAPFIIENTADAKAALSLHSVIKNNETGLIETCLHCGNEVRYLYCAHCGQSIKTSRFHVRHIFSRDLTQGMYNLSPGILYTLRSLATRPGHAVREYIHGKRANFLNYFSFFLLAITVLHFIHEYAHIQIEQLFATKISRSILWFRNTIIRNNSKLYAFAMTPVVSVASYLAFRKAHQNFAEHLVLNIFKTGAGMLLITFFYALTIVFSDHLFLKVAYVAFFILQMAYETFFYYQYFSAFGYARINLLMRSFLVATFSMALLIDKWIIIF